MGDQLTILLHLLACEVFLGNPVPQVVRGESEVCFVCKFTAAFNSGLIDPAMLDPTIAHADYESLFIITIKLLQIGREAVVTPKTKVARDKININAPVRIN